MIQDSLNLKCNQKNHLSEDKVAICLKESCKNNRLLCWKCISQFHFDHHDYAFGISDIKNNILENWPADESIRKIQKEFNSSSFDQIASKLESLFEIFTANFLNEIDLIKKQILSQINSKNEMDLFAKLKNSLDQAFNLGPIRDAINEISIEKFYEKEKEFDAKINNFLSSKNEVREKAIATTQQFFTEWSSKYQFILDEKLFDEISKNSLEILNGLASALKKKNKTIVKMEFSGTYFANNKTAGTNNFNDLTDLTLTKGICANTPGWIILEYHQFIDFKAMNVAGWHGDSSLWSPNNGNGADILVSLDKNNWVSIGKLPDFSQKKIQKIEFNTLKSAKFLKFQHSSYLGIGFLELLD